MFVAGFMFFMNIGIRKDAYANVLLSSDTNIFQTPFLTLSGSSHRSPPRSASEALSALVVSHTYSTFLYSPFSCKKYYEHQTGEVGSRVITDYREKCLNGIGSLAIDLSRGSHIEKRADVLF